MPGRPYTEPTTKTKPVNSPSNSPKAPSKQASFQLLDFTTTITAKNDNLSKVGLVSSKYSYVVTLSRNGNGKLFDFLNKNVYGANNRPWLIAGSSDSFRILLTSSQAHRYKTWNVGDTIVLYLSPSMLINYLQKNTLNSSLHDYLIDFGDPLLVPIEELIALGYAKLYHPLETSVNGGTTRKDPQSALNGSNDAVSKAISDDVTKTAATRKKHSEFDLTDFMDGWPKIIPIPNITEPNDSITIGYTSLSVPLASLLIDKQTQPITVPIVRAAGNVKRGVGASIDRFTFLYQVQGYDDVERNVCGILNQLLHTPFLPFWGIDELENVDAIAIKNFSISTMAGTPDALQVQITAEPFMWNQYCSTLHNERFEDSICWPLFQLWCETKGKKARFSHLGDNRWSNGKLVFQYPDQLAAKAIEVEASTLDPIRSKDYDVYEFFKNLAACGGDSNAYIKMAMGNGIEGNPVALVTDVRGNNLSIPEANTKCLVAAIRVQDAQAFKAIMSDPSFCFGVYPNAASTLVTHLLPLDVGPQFDLSSTSAATLCEAMRNTNDRIYANIDTGTVWNEVANLDSGKWQDMMLLVVINAFDSTSRQRFLSLLTPFVSQKPKEAPKSTDKYVVSSSIATDLRTRYNTTRELSSKGEQQAEAWSTMKSLAPLYEIATELNSDTVVIEEVSVSRSHNLAHHQVRGYGQPSHQYMGTSDALITIRGLIFSLDEMMKLQSFIDESNKRSRQALTPTSLLSPSLSYAGYAMIENDVCSLMGIDFVMPLSLSFQAKESDPGAWDFTLVMVEYDPITQSQEAARELQTTNNLAGKPIDFNGDLPPWIATTEQYLEVEKQIKETWEPYPEMSLPTWQELDAWIKVLKRLANGNAATTEIESMVEYHCAQWIQDYKGSLLLLQPSNDLKGWADPDFYMGYWKAKGNKIVPEPVGSVPMFEALYASFGDPKKREKSPLDKKDTEKPKPYKPNAEPVSANISHRQSDKDDHKGVMFGKTLTLESREELAFKKETAGVGDPDYIKKNLDHEEDGQATQEARIASFKEQLDMIRSVDPVYADRISEGTISALSALATSPILNAQTGTLQSTLSASGMKAELAAINPAAYAGSIVIKTGENVPWIPNPANYTIADWATLRNTLAESISELRIVTENARNYLDKKTSGVVDYRQWPLPAISNIVYGDVLRQLQVGENEFFVKRTVTAGSGTGPYGIIPTLNVVAEKFWERGSPDTPSWEGNFFSDGKLLTTGTTAQQIDTFSFANSSLEDFMLSSQRNAVYMKARSKDTRWTSYGIEEDMRNDSGKTLLYSNKTFNVNLALRCTGLKPVDMQLMRAIFITTGANWLFQQSVDDGLEFRTSIGQLTESDRVKYIDTPGYTRDSLLNEIAACCNKYRDHLFKWGNLPVLALLAYRLGDANLSGYLIKAIQDGLKKPDGGSYNTQVGTSTDIIPRICSSVNSANSDAEKISWYRSLTTSLLSRTNLDPAIGPAIEFVHIVYHEWKAGTCSHGLTTYPKDNDTIIGWNNQSLFACKGKSNTQFSPIGATDLYCPMYSTCPENKFWNEEYWTTGSFFALKGTDTAEVKATDVVIDEGSYRQARSILSPHTARGIVGAFKDSYEYDNSGRLVNAFPNYLILFIDEGSSFGRIKLWDKYYIRGGVSSIEVNTSKDRPTAVAQVTLSNLFSRLNSQSIFDNTLQDIIETMRKSGLTSMNANPSMGTIMKEAFGKQVGAIVDPLLYKIIPEWITKAWQTHINKIAIQAGTRLHIRMGYGSNPAALPTCFNGTISEMPVSDGMLTLVALSDGAEMTNELTHSLTFDEGKTPMYFQRGGIAGGKEPAAIMHDMFSARGAIATLTAGTFLGDPNAGLAHWGNMWFIGELGSPANRYNPTEIQINMYTSSPNLERDYSIWRNFFNVNVFYNFDDVNLIGVKVKEPTPWKVSQVLRKAVFDYIAYPYPFQFRHTMFYGNKFYPLYFRYNSVPLVSPEQKKILQVVEAAQKKINTDRSVITESQAYDAAVTIMLTVGDSIFMGALKGWDEKLLKQDPKDILTDDEVEMWRIGKTATGIWNSWPQEILNNIKPNTSVFANWADNTEFKALAGAIQKYFYSIPAGDPVADSLRSALWDGVEAFGRIQYVTQKDVGMINNLFNPVYVPTNRVALFPMKDLFGRQVKGDQYHALSSGRLSDREVQDINDPEWVSQFMDWKPFCQVHFVDSQTNLISNEVTASDEKVYTNATGVYNYGGMNLLWLGRISDIFTGAQKSGGDYIAQTRTYSVDTDIMPHYQRTMLVDTGLYTDWMMAGWQAILGVSQVANSMGQPATPGVENAVVSTLLDSVKTMYQGWFVIQGSPTMWPHHMIHVNDSRSSLNGLAGVREVTQHFSADMGFVTGISPECIVVSRSSQHEMLWINAIAVQCMRQATMNTAIGVLALVQRGFARLEMKGAWQDAQKLSKEIESQLPKILEGALTNAAEKQTVALIPEYKAKIEKRLLDAEADLKFGSGKTPGSAVKTFDELASVEKESVKMVLDRRYKTAGGFAKEVASVAREEAAAAVRTTFTEATKMAKGGNVEFLKMLTQYGLDTDEYRALASMHNRVADIRIKQREIMLTTGNPKKAEQFAREAIGQIPREEIELAKRHLMKTNPAAMAEGRYAFLLDDTGVLKNALAGSRWSAQAEGFSAAQLLAMNTEAKVAATTALNEAGVAIIKEQPAIFNTMDYLMDTELQAKALQNRAAHLNWTSTVEYDIATKKWKLSNVKWVSSTASTAELEALKLLKVPPGEFITTAAKAAQKDILTVGRALSTPKLLVSRAAALLSTENKYRKEAEVVIKFMRRMMSGEGMLASIATGQLHLVAIQLAVFTVQVVMFDTFMDAINDYFTARQIAAVFPLKMGFLPLLAGLLGHQGCVVGDEPGMMDNLISSVTGGPVGDHVDRGCGLLTTILNAVGVEPVNYNIIGADTKGDQ